MLEEFAWKQFLATGDIETYMEYKMIQKTINENEGEKIDETYQSEGNCNT